MISILKFNQQIFKETSRIIQLGHYIDFDGHFHDISEKLKKSIGNTITIPDSYSFDNSLSQQFGLRDRYGEAEKRKILSRIEITQESTQAAARRFKENNVNDVCILNFGNGFYPGGGILDGSTTKEETLARQSNLYFCLKNQHEMYQFNKEHSDNFCSDYMIYSQDVIFFRDDEYELVYPIVVSVITISAVDLHEIQLNDEVIQKFKNVMKNRIRRTLQMGVRTKRKVMILGSFCDEAFQNSPNAVSEIFRELLVDEFYGIFFTKIVFPICGQSGQDNPSYDAFKETFQKQ